MDADSKSLIKEKFIPVIVTALDPAGETTVENIENGMGLSKILQPVQP